MNIVRQIVGNCHVGMTNKKVIRYVISRLKHRERTFWAMSKQDRRLLMQTAIDEHSDNRQLYLDVMTGNL